MIDEDATINELKARIIQLENELSELKSNQNLHHNISSVSETQFRLLVDNAPEPIFIHVNYKFVYLNRAAIELYGAQSAAELIGTSLLERIHPDYVDLVKDRVKTLHKENIIVRTTNYKHLRLDKSVISVEVAAVPLVFENQKGTLVFIKDITDRIRIENEIREKNDEIKSSEEELREANAELTYITATLEESLEELQDAKQKIEESKEKFNKIFDRAPVLISISDIKDGTYIDVNDFALKFIEFTKDEVIGHKLYEIGWITEENRMLLLKTLVENGKIENLELPFKTKSGKEVYGLVNGDKIVIDKKECLLTITADITQHVKVEKALIESEQNLNEAQRIAKIGNFYYDIRNSELKLSKECKRIYEIEDSIADEYVKDEIKKKILPEDFILLCDSNRQAVQNNQGYSLEYRINVSSGIKHILSIVEPVRDHQNIMIGLKGTLQDITERKSAEEAILQAEINHKRFMDESTLGIRILTKDGKTVYVNNALLEIYGFSSEDEYFSTNVIHRYTNDEYKRHLERKEKRKKGEDLSSEYTIEIIHKEGKIRYLDVLRKEIIWDKTPHFQVIYQDITERKRSEQELIIAKEKAEESDRLKSAFLQNMSHEVRTPLNAIMGFTKIMSRANQNPDKLKGYSKIITSKSLQLINIITDVIEISQIHASQIKIKLSEFDLISVLKNLVVPFEKEAKEKNLNFRIELDFHSPECIINSDHDKLKKIFKHIVNNAVKFTLEGYVEIKCYIKGSVLHFLVKDTGIGIPKDMLEIIFEPFRQVETGISRKFGGNGLGLAIARSYTEELGGKIVVHSELNAGTSIEISIPVKKADDLKVNRQLYEKNNEHTILVAEDEYSNYQFLYELLEETGAVIIHAVNGQQAVDFIKTNNSISLILMDIKMPIMDGQTAARIIKEIKPGIPVIAQTAYALENEMASFTDDFDDYITKPINEDELRLKLNKFINLFFK